jgi:hypothetical protein
MAAPPGGLEALGDRHAQRAWRYVREGTRRTRAQSADQFAALVGEIGDKEIGGPAVVVLQPRVQSMRV